MGIEARIGHRHGNVGTSLLAAATAAGVTAALVAGHSSGAAGAPAEVSLAAAIAAAPTSMALREAGAMYLKLDGVAGESTAAAHPGEIEIESFSWGVSNATRTSSTGLSAGKAGFGDLSLTAPASKASPLLMLRAAQGTHIKKAVLTVAGGGESAQDYYKVTLEDVLISSYKTAGPSMLDAVKLDYARILIEYRPQNQDGSLGAAVKAGWDVVANKKV